MDYKKHYDLLISTRLLLKKERKVLHKQHRIQITKATYFERHHIIPKCLGGSNNKENIILLTAREHYIAHWLLSKIYPHTNLVYAQWQLSHDKQNRYLKINSRKYELLKEKHSKHTSNRMKLRTGKLNPMYGKVVSDETKLKIGNSIRGELNGNYGIDPWKSAPVSSNKNALDIWKKLNIYYDIWVIANKPAYKLFKKICHANSKNLNLNTKTYKQTFQSFIRYFKNNRNPVDNDAWVRWIGNEYRILDFEPIIFRINSWDHYSVRDDIIKMQLWAIADKIYKVWQSNDKITSHKKLSTKCYSSGLILEKYHLKAFIEFFINYGDPAQDRDWIAKFKLMDK